MPLKRAASRFNLAALICLPVLACLIAGPASAFELSGTWITENGRSLIRTEPCERERARLCGYVVWLKSAEGQPLRDQRNPFVERRTRNLLGHQMLLGLKAHENGQYKGLVYDYTSGKTFVVTVWSGEGGELVVRGKVPGAYCGYQVLTRATDVMPGQLQGRTDTVSGPRSDPEWTSFEATPKEWSDRRKHMTADAANPKY